MRGALPLSNRVRLGAEDRACAGFQRDSLRPNWPLLPYIVKSARLPERDFLVPEGVRQDLVQRLLRRDKARRRPRFH